MAYTIYKSDGSAVTVADNSIDTSYYNPTGGSTNLGMGLQLVGRNTIGYGAAIAQNILQSAENFCNSTVPADSVALQGQLWFNQLSDTTGKLYVRTSGATSGGIANWGQIPVLDSSGDLVVTGNLTVDGSITPVSGFATSSYATLSQAEAGISTTLLINPNTLVGTVNSILAGGSIGTATNLAGGGAGEIPYQTSAGHTSFVPVGTNGEVLTLVGGLPVWGVSSTGVSSITGTANQIITSSSTGNVTLSLPQSIATSSSPTFGGLTVNSSTAGIATLQLISNNNFGGTGDATLLEMINTTSGATNPNKFFRIGATGNYGIVNSAYTSEIFTLDDSGDLYITGQSTATQFNGPLNGNASSATNAGNINVTATAANTNYALALLPSDTTGYKAVVVDSSNSIYWNTSTKNLVITGTATVTGTLTLPGNKLDFAGTGTILGTQSTYGMWYQPSANGSSYAHTWVNAAASGVMYLTSTGNLLASGTVTGTSDERLKTNWKDLPIDYLEKLSKVKMGTYDRTDIVANHAGVSAQDMQTILPQVVEEGADGMLSLGYGNAAMVSIVALTRRVLELEAKLAKLLK